MELSDLRALGTNGTVLEPVVEALNRAGIDTEQTLGSVMDSMKFTRSDAHCLVCDCHVGDTHMDCDTIAMVLLARKERGRQ